MDIHDGLYYCKCCKKIYSSYKSLWNHNNKFHNDKNENVKNDVKNVKKNVKNVKENVKFVKSLTCEFCNKIFNNRPAKSIHKKTCKSKITVTNIQNNNNTNNINNGTINNNISINQFGSESLSKLTSEDIKKIADSNYNSVIEIVKLLNFNKNFPENHNFCTTSLEGSYVNVYNSDTKQIDKINKDDFYNNVLAKSMDKMDRLVFMLEFDDNYEDIREKYKKILEDIIKDPMVFCRKSSKTTYNKNINQMSYNNKSMILDTWTTRMKDYEDDGGESIFTDVDLSTL
jgi:hypothetical protein